MKTKVYKVIVICAGTYLIFMVCLGFYHERWRQHRQYTIAVKNPQPSILQVHAVRKETTLKKYFKAIEQRENYQYDEDLPLFEVVKPFAELGPYQITHAYWIDSGVKEKFTVINANNKLLCHEVIKRYALRWEPTAWHDQDFYVLASLHNGGCNWKNRNLVEVHEYAKSILNLMEIL